MRAVRSLLSMRLAQAYKDKKKGFSIGQPLHYKRGLKEVFGADLLTPSAKEQKITCTEQCIFFHFLAYD